MPVLARPRYEAFAPALQDQPAVFHKEAIAAAAANAQVTIESSSDARGSYDW